MIIGFKDERVVSRLRCSCRASGVCESISISSVCVELRWDSGEITTQVDLLQYTHSSQAGANWLINIKCTYLIFDIFNGLCKHTQTVF